MNPKSRMVFFTCIGATALTATLVAASAGLGIRGDSAPASAGEPRPLAGEAAILAPGASPAPSATEAKVSVGPYVIPAHDLQGWLASASEPERTLFEDGVLTFAEYQSAVMQTISCMESAGVTVVHFPGYGRGGIGEPGPRLSRRGVYSYVGAVNGAADRPPTEAAAATAACKSGSAQVEFAWAQHTAPSEVELQAMRDQMAKCLRDAGATLSQDHPSDADLKRAKSAGASEETYWKCQFAAADAFEIDRLPG